MALSPVTQHHFSEFNDAALDVLPSQCDQAVSEPAACLKLGDKVCTVF